MPILVHANEATAAQRRVYFDLRDATDGITAETGEAGGQPQISTNGAAWTNTGIGTLTDIGNGRYYADLTQAAVATAGDIVETRYKSANTAESPGDSVQVVAFDPADAVRLGLSSLPNAAADAAGGLPISDAGGLDLDTRLNRLDATLTDRTLAAAAYATAAGVSAVETDTQDIQSKIGTPSVTLAADLSAVQINTNSILGAGNTGQSLVSVQALIDTEVAAILAAVDTEVAAIKAKTDNLPASPAAVGSEMALADGAITAAKIAAAAITAAKFAAGALDAAALAADAGNELADALLDRTSAIDGYTVREILRVLAASLGGEVAGAATSTVTIRDIADTKTRITATVDSDGNRTALTIDAT